MNIIREAAERKRRNQDLMERFMRGESLQGKASETWFPPRPNIEKDMEAVKRLYKETGAAPPPCKLVVFKEEPNDAKNESPSTTGYDEKRPEPGN